MCSILFANTVYVLWLYIYERSYKKGFSTPQMSAIINTQKEQFHIITVVIIGVVLPLNIIIFIVWIIKIDNS